MVIFPLAAEAVNFASLWVLYSFQSEDYFQLAIALLTSADFFVQLVNR